MLTIIKDITKISEQKGEICAAGTDVYARRRLGISTGELVDISGLDELTQLRVKDNDSSEIGALVKVKTLAEHPQIRAHYPALAKAAAGLATPQIRAMASVGGNLLQRNRCWYYRNPAFSCFKSGGEGCPARTGNHRQGVAFDRGACVAVHPSTLAMALRNYDVKVEIDGQEIWTLDQLLGDGSQPEVDHLLPAGRLLTKLILPAPVANEIGSYSRAISRFEAEWAMVEASIRMVIENNKIQLARVAIGAVANVPLGLPDVNSFLEGKTLNKAIIKEAAKLAAADANPLPMTQYKVDLIYGTVTAALLEILEK